MSREIRQRSRRIDYIRPLLIASRKIHENVTHPTYFRRVISRLLSDDGTLRIIRENFPSRAHQRVGIFLG